jgi:DNA helicase-2/ATP-dependent DNA helicase PcrA
LGGQAEAAVQAYAAGHGMSFGAALAHHQDIDALTPRAKRSLAELDHLLGQLREMSQGGGGPAQVLDYLLDKSGYLAELQESRDPQDASRVENLAELHAVASEFEQSQPDGTLADFLERVSLVADSDQLPPKAGAADAEEAGAQPAADSGQVTLMTVHTAKGLEFPVVFVTGMEEGTFPHHRSQGNEEEMEEERRLAYVALTRARRRLYLTRAEARTTFGRPAYFGPSQFLRDVPEDVLDWRRERGSSGALQPEIWDGGRDARRLAPSRRPRDAARPAPSFGSATPRPEADVPNLEPGDLVTHDAYGLGHVTAVEGTGANQVARIEFREEGVKRILLRFAPVTKL